MAIRRGLHEVPAILEDLILRARGEDRVEEELLILHLQGDSAVAPTEPPSPSSDPLPGPDFKASRLYTMIRSAPKGLPE